VVLLVCFMMVIRWSLPRLRYDQVMMMAWQAIIPLSMVVLVMTAVMVYFDLRGVGPMLAANAVLGVVCLLILPLLKPTKTNKRIAIYGSRFSPTEGERVVTRPTNVVALEDRPVQGTAPSI
ncbi:MAG: NADH-quinone oxidoreductase subunit H, partial [Phycisphaerales bacterium JB041]